MQYLNLTSVLNIPIYLNSKYLPILGKLDYFTYYFEYGIRYKELGSDFVKLTYLNTLPYVTIIASYTHDISLYNRYRVVRVLEEN